MSCFSKSTYAILLLAAGLAIVLACGGGSSNSTSSSGVPVDEVITYRTMTGTLAEASNSVPGEALEATYRLSDINRIKCVDHLGNTYVSSVENGEFSINLPAGWSYTVAFLVNNNFAASIYYDNKNWFKMQDKPGKHLALGQVRIDIDIQRGTPENDPWEGADPEGTSPWEDANNDGIPDIFKNPHTYGGTGTVTEEPIAELAITTGTLPDGGVGIAYSAELAATGGVAPYSWSVSLDSLPDGLKFDTSTGVISGTPTTYGVSNMTIKVTDTRDISLAQDFTLTIGGIYITTTSPFSLPDATNCTAYTTTLTAEGHPANFTWSLVAGTLPSGITLDADTGEIFGTPTSAGNYTFTVKATNGTWDANREFTLKVIGNLWAEKASAADPFAKHSATVIGDKMYVFGTASTNLWEYHPDANMWTLLTPTGGPPTARQYCSTETINGKMYLFAGKDGGGYKNDLWAYDPIANTWTLLTPVGGPPAVRDSHCAAVIDNKMYIFGGWDELPNKNDLWVYDSGANTWTQLAPVGGPPAARRSHSAVAINGKMYVFAGYDGSYKNDLWVYDPDANTWTQLNPVGTPPSGRWGHSAAVIDNRMCVFGGIDPAYGNDLWKYDPGVNTWTQLAPADGPPAARRGHSATVINGKMYIFGGLDVGLLKDLWEYTP